MNSLPFSQDCQSLNMSALPSHPAGLSIFQSSWRIHYQKGYVSAIPKRLFYKNANKTKMVGMDTKTARTLNIIELVESAGGQAEWIRKYGGERWGQSQVSQWVNATKPKPIGHRLARDIEEVMGLERGDLDKVDSGVEDATWADILASEQSLAAGGGTVPDEYAESHKLKFKASSLRKKGLNPESLQVFYVSGESMTPRLHDGDAILVDTSDTRVKNGRIYWISHEGEYFVKIVHMKKTDNGDLYWYESMNKDDQRSEATVIVTEGEQFEVIGRVRWVGSWED